MSYRFSWPMRSSLSRTLFYNIGGSNHSARLVVRKLNIAGNGTIKPGANLKKTSPYSYLFLVFPVATFCLGTWQVYRLQWKRDLIDKLKKMMESSPSDLKDCLADLENLEYTKVKVRGYIDTSSMPLFIFPRSLVKQTKSEREAGTGLISTSNASNIGAQLVLPFVVTDPSTREALGARFDLDGSNNPRILVNLGWVSKETMDKINALLLKALEHNQLPLQDKNNETIKEVELVGVIRKSEKREPFRPKQESNYGYWNRRDIDKMCEVQSSVPVFLDATDSYPITISEKHLIPMAAQTRVNLRNEHFSYILTWYSLTALFSFLCFRKMF